MFKKNIAKLLVFAMLLSMLPFTVAANGTTTTTTQSNETPQASAGTYVTLSDVKVTANGKEYPLSSDEKNGLTAANAIGYTYKKTNEETLATAQEAEGATLSFKVTLTSGNDRVFCGVYTLTNDSTPDTSGTNLYKPETTVPAVNNENGSINVSFKMENTSGSPVKYGIVTASKGSTEQQNEDDEKSDLTEECTFISVTVPEDDSSEYTITVNAGENGSASADKTTAAANTQITVTATPSPDDYEVDTITATYDTNKTVTVSGEGPYTFLMPAGDVTVNVTFKAKAPATVEVTGISLSDSSIELEVGESKTLTVTYEPENATEKSVTWTSSNPDIATVNATSGEVKAILVGTTTITATTSNGKTASCEVTVKSVSVKSVTLNKQNTSMIVGETETLTATVLPANAANKVVTWSSSDSEVASVENGVVTAKKKGTATITVTTQDGDKTDTCSVTVGNAGDYMITMDTESATLTFDSEKPDAAAASGELSVTVRPIGSNVSWTSSAPAVVSVTPNDEDSSKATIKALAVSSDPVTITATVLGADGQTAKNDGVEVPAVTCSVTVDEAPETQTYTVTMVNGTETETADVEVDTEYLLPVLDKEGYTFGGWYVNEDFTGEPVTTVSKETTVYAKWTEDGPKPADTHTVTINQPTVGGKITVTVGSNEVATGSSHAHDSQVTVTAEAAAGYKLDKVTVQVGEATPTDNTTVPYTFKLTDNAKVSATFVKEDYKVSIAEIDKDGDKVMGEVAFENETKQMGDKVSFTVTAAEGYEISSVTAADAAGKNVPLTKGENGAYSFEMPASNVEIKAVFKAKEVKKYAVTVNATPTEGGAAKANVVEAAEGTEVVVTITPAEGYVIQSITNNGVAAAIPGEDKYIFTMPGADVIIEVVFAQLPESVNAVVETETKPENEVTEEAPEEVQKIAQQATNALAGTKTNLNKVVESLLDNNAGEDVAIKGVKETVSKQKITEAQNKLVANGANRDDISTVVVPKIVIALTGGSAADGKITALSFKIDARAQVMVTTANVANGEKLTEDNAEQAGEIDLKDTTEPIEITIPLLSDVLKDLSNDLVVKHVKSSTSTFYHKATKTMDGVKFTNSRGFSEFTVENAAGFEAEYNGEYYPTLQEAVDAVAADGTIKVLKDGAKATVSREITFTLTGANADISAGSGYEKKESNNTYTFTKESSGGGSTGGGGGGGSSRPSIKPGETQKPNAPTTTPSGGVAGFNDVATGSWYAEYVQYVVDKGLFDGVGDGNFAPNANMTRAMMWTVLARYMGVDTKTTNGNWYEAAQAWAIAQGISDGTMATSNVTREQFVTMLWRLCGEPAATSSASFTDNGSVSAYAKTAVDWAVAQGIVNGYNDGSFKPQGSATRAEVAKMLTVFCTNAENAPAETTPTETAPEEATPTETTPEDTSADVG